MSDLVFVGTKAGAVYIMVRLIMVIVEVCILLRDAHNTRIMLFSLIALTKSMVSFEKGVGMNMKVCGVD